MIPENWSMDDVRGDPVGETTQQVIFRNPINANYLVIFWSEFGIAPHDSAEAAHYRSEK
jgi:hypothetical protein